MTDIEPGDAAFGRKKAYTRLAALLTDIEPGDAAFGRKKAYTRLAALFTESNLRRAPVNRTIARHLVAPAERQNS